MMEITDSTLATPAKSRRFHPIAFGQGFAEYRIESEFQRGANLLTVLTPREIVSGHRYPVVYILPVELGPDEAGGMWGMALRAAEGLAETYQAICVIPSFDTLPWYGDNDCDSAIRHESYLMRVVLPFIEAGYPTLREQSGRLLLGFSKSGWGAVSLLLRYPEVFGRAAAWDAPLMLDWTPEMGLAAHFGDEASFRRCHIPTLLERQAAQLRESPRLILMGHDNFREDLPAAKQLLDRLGIPHVFRDGPRRVHHWESGWVPEAMELLMEVALDDALSS